jgi:hypothetical protein
MKLLLLELFYKVKRISVFVYKPMVPLQILRNVLPLKFIHKTPALQLNDVIFELNLAIKEMIYSIKSCNMS